MGKRIESLEAPAFGALFTGVLHTAYRLEQLQVYDVGYENESYRRFLAGEPASDPAQDEWTGMIRDAVRTGRVFQRVHVVAEPLTDYLRYEMSIWYPQNVEAGEDIRILSAEQWLQPLRPPADYWLFDSRDLWVMQYDENGQFLCCEKNDDPADIVTHCYWSDAALHGAAPFREYMDRIPDLQRIY
jgi:hypothetical protein